MKKLIRPVYPIEISGIIVCFLLLITFLFSNHIFNIRFHLHNAEKYKAAYGGMFLISIAAVTAMLIIWEEILFPVVIKEYQDSLKVRNRSRKLQVQALMYLIILVIFAFIYFNYKVVTFHFIAWMSVCLIAPLVSKLVGGIKNYNDFLTLSTSEIEYKNNEKEGKFLLAKIKHMCIIKDGDNILSKLKLVMNNDTEVTIDLDEMELEAFYDTIQNFIQRTYKNLLI